MHLLQHIILSLIDELKANDNIIDLERFKRTVPYTALPDTIRFHTKNRKYSHFEMNNIDFDINNNPFNGMKYPLDIKDSESIIYKDSDSDMNTGAIGGNTSIDYFMCVNNHLPDMYKGEVREHLEQDIWYDNWIRDNFDCSRSSEGIFYAYNIDDDKIQLNAGEFRELVSILESCSLIFLTNYLKEDQGFVIDQSFINNYILIAFEEAYTEDMYNNTVKYFNLDEIVECNSRTPEFIDSNTFNRYKEDQIEFIMEYVRKEPSKLPRSRSNWSTIH